MSDNSAIRGKILDNRDSVLFLIPFLEAYHSNDILVSHVLVLSALHSVPR